MIFAAPFLLLPSGGAFDPTSVFAGADVGDIWNPYDAATTFQDTAAATPAGLSDPVGRVNGLRGSINLTQGTAGRRPALGAAARKLIFDGDDDGLATPNIAFASSKVTFGFAGLIGSRAAVAEMLVESSATSVGTTNTFGIFRGGSGDDEITLRANSGGLFQQTLTVSASVPVVLVVEFDNAVTTGCFRAWVNGSAASLTANTAAKTTTGNFSTQPLNLGARDGGAALPIELEGGPAWIINRVMTDTQRDDMTTWMAGEAEISL